MTSFFTSFGGGAVAAWLLCFGCAGLGLALLPAGTARAQAPAWELAMSGTNTPPSTTGTSLATAAAADASGNVFVTGSFSGTVSFGNTLLTNAGTGTTTDVFVAKWDATAQAFTWATSAGGTGGDTGQGIAVSGRNVYVTGTFASNTSASFAGQMLAGAGDADVFVAKYVDTSTGSTPATSSFANAWATSGGGTGNDVGADIAVSGTNVYVTGSFTSNTNASIAGQALVGAGGQDAFVAKYVDTSMSSTPTINPFANAWATSAGGTSGDTGHGIAVSGRNVFVTGGFSSNTNASIAGQALAGAGIQDVFVAKYVDTSTGSTPATSSFANAWATSGGGTGNDLGHSIAVSGTNVYVTGAFASNTFASIAGQTLTGAGGDDVFVAKYVDTSTGSTPATSSFINAWATRAGGTGSDRGRSVVVNGSRVYVAGNAAPPATFGSINFGSSASSSTNFLAGLPAVARAVAAGATAQVLTLSPNPAHDVARLTGVTPHAAVVVLDALGRPVSGTTADAAGTARLALPAGRAPGVYLVRSGSQVRRLVVE